MFYTSLTIVLGFMILVSSNFNPSVFFGIFTSFSMIVAILAALMLLPVLIRHLNLLGEIRVGPLKDIKVIEMAGIGPAPFAA